MLLNVNVTVTVYHLLYILHLQYKGVYRNTMPQNIDYSALLQDEENLDPSPSDEVEVILPTNQEGM